METKWHQKSLKIQAGTWRGLSRRLKEAWRGFWRLQGLLGVKRRLGNSGPAECAESLFIQNSTEFDDPFGHALLPQRGAADSNAPRIPPGQAQWKDDFSKKFRKNGCSHSLAIVRKQSQSHTKDQYRNQPEIIQHSATNPAGLVRVRLQKKFPHKRCIFGFILVVSSTPGLVRVRLQNKFPYKRCIFGFTLAVPSTPGP